MNLEDEKTAEYFNRYTPEFGLDKLELIVDFIKTNLDSDSFFLDVGCGCGNILEMIKNETGNKKFYGMDIAQNYLNEAVKRVNCTPILGSILSEEIVQNHKEKFDCVMLSSVLHHLIGKTRKASFELVNQALKNAFQLVKPGGFLIVAEPAYTPAFSSDIIFNIKNFFAQFCNGRIEIFSQGVNIGQPIVSFLTPEQIKNMLEKIDGAKLLTKDVSFNGVPLAMRFIGVTGTYKTSFILKK